MARKNRLNDRDFSTMLYVLSPVDFGVINEDEINGLESVVGEGEVGVPELREILLPHFANFNESQMIRVKTALENIITNKRFDFEWIFSHVELYFDIGDDPHLFFRNIWEALFETKAPFPE